MSLGTARLAGKLGRQPLYRCLPNPPAVVPQGGEELVHPRDFPERQCQEGLVAQLFVSWTRGRSHSLDRPISSLLDDRGTGSPEVSRAFRFNKSFRCGGSPQTPRK